MIDIKRYNGKEELDKLLSMFTVAPTNTEIVEKTGVSKGSVSEIMNGKRKPTKKFIDKFIKGYNLDNTTETKKPPPEESSFYVTLKEHNEYLLKEIEFLREMLRKK